MKNGLRYVFIVFVLVSFGLIKAQDPFVRFYKGTPSTNTPNVYSPSLPYCLEKTIDGGFLIGGATGEPDTPGMSKMHLRKVDSQGNQLWEVKDRVTFNDEVIDLIEYDDSTIYCVAQIGSKAGLVKRNGQGELQWAKVIVPTLGVCSKMNDILKSSDGGIVMCGGVVDCNSASPGILTAKFVSAGNILWLDSIMIPYGASALSVIQDFSKNYVVTGFTGYFDTINLVSVSQFFILKYSSAGQKIGFDAYGDSIIGYQGRGIAQLEDSSYVVVGSCNYPPLYADAFISAVSKDGELLYSYFDSISNNYFTRVKSDGMYATVVGISYENFNTDTLEDIRILRYSKLTDSIEFKKTINMPGSQSTYCDLELLSNENIALSFYEQSSNCFSCTGLMVLDSTGCAPELCNLTGVSNSTTMSLKVYPNPFNRELFIDSEMPAEYWFYNPMGVLLKQGKTNFSRAVLFDENLPDGIYFISIKIGDNTYVHKLIHHQ